VWERQQGIRNDAVVKTKLKGMAEEVMWQEYHRLQRQELANTRRQRETIFKFRGDVFHWASTLAGQQ
jgi:hypothetical protein